ARASPAPRAGPETPAGCQASPVAARSPFDTDGAVCCRGSPRAGDSPARLRSLPTPARRRGTGAALAAAGDAAAGGDSAAAVDGVCGGSAREAPSAPAPFPCPCERPAPACGGSPGGAPPVGQAGEAEAAAAPRLPCASSAAEAEAAAGAGGPGAGAEAAPRGRPLGGRPSWGMQDGRWRQLGLRRGVPAATVEQAVRAYCLSVCASAAARAGRAGPGEEAGACAPGRAPAPPVDACSPPCRAPSRGAGKRWSPGDGADTATTAGPSGQATPAWSCLDTSRSDRPGSPDLPDAVLQAAHTLLDGGAGAKPAAADAVTQGAGAPAAAAALSAAVALRRAMGLQAAAGGAAPRAAG
ncbi:unnamed protein product, partial [Prorocentrum cordatum]